MKTNKSAINQTQLRAKAAGRLLAAQAPFEEKIDKLVRLQKLNFELAQKSGRPAKRPWNLPAREVDS